jgi:hypothetical protein
MKLAVGTAERKKLKTQRQRQKLRSGFSRLYDVIPN